MEDESLAKLPDLGNWHGDGIIADLDDRSVARAVARVAISVVGFGSAQSPRTSSPAVTMWRRRQGDRPSGRRPLARARVPAVRVLRRTAERPEPAVRAARRGPSGSGSRRPAIRVRSTPAGTPRPSAGSRFRRGWREWLEPLRTPLGLMACHDSRARHVLEACHRVGRRVPDDVAVIGVDNDEVMCDLAHPPLSSVIQGTHRMGYEAAALLDRLMGGDPSPSVVDRGRASRRRHPPFDGRAGGRGRQGRRGDSVHPRPRRRRAAGRPTSLARSRLSRTALDFHFQQALGHTTHDEIHRAQVARAQELLTTTDLPLKQVAQRRGSAMCST